MAQKIKTLCKHKGKLRKKDHNIFWYINQKR